MLLLLGVLEKREYAIAAYLAPCRILHILAKCAYRIFFPHVLAFSAALNILCSNFFKAMLQKLTESRKTAGRIRNSSVFSVFPKLCRYCDAVIDGGRLFQVYAAAAGKERSPINSL